MIPVFIGYDRRETIAYHVLAHSLLKHATVPLAITPVGNDVLPKGRWWRERGPHDSTDFSNARFMVPALMGYRGWAIFMDCDMVALGDVAELFEQRDPGCAVQVVQHVHEPAETVKFLGAEQSKYSRKNWSSLMLINCGHPLTRALSEGYVNTAPGFDLHQLRWAGTEVGEITGLWNVLVAPDFQHPEPVDRFNLKLLHYTLGGPWHGYEPEGASYWLDALWEMIAGGNPCAALNVFGDGPGVHRFVGQFKERFAHEQTP